MHALLAAATGLLVLALPLCSPLAGAAKEARIFKPAKFIPGAHPSDTNLDLTTPKGNFFLKFMHFFRELDYCGYVDGGDKAVDRFNQRNESAQLQELCRQVVRHCQREASKFCRAENDGCDLRDLGALGDKCFFNALPTDPGFYETLTQNVATKGGKMPYCVAAKIIAPYVREEDLPFFLCLAGQKSRFKTIGTGGGLWNNNAYGMFGLSSDYGWCVKTDSQIQTATCLMKCSNVENFNMKDDLSCVFDLLGHYGLDHFGNRVYKRCCNEASYKSWSASRLCDSKFADATYKSLGTALPTPHMCTLERGLRGQFEYDRVWYRKNGRGKEYDGTRDRQIEYRHLGAPLPTGTERTPMKTYENLFGDEKEDAAGSGPSLYEDSEYEDAAGSELALDEELLKRTRRMAEAVMDFLDADAAFRDDVPSPDTASQTGKHRRSTKREGRVQLTDDLKYRHEFDEKRTEYADNAGEPLTTTRIGRDRDFAPFVKRSVVEDEEGDDYEQQTDNESLYDNESVPRSDRSALYEEEKDDEEDYEEEREEEYQEEREEEHQDDESDGPRFGRTQSMYHDDDVEKGEGNDDVPEDRDENIPRQRKSHSQPLTYSEKYKCAIIVDAVDKAMYKGRICSQARIDEY